MAEEDPFVADRRPWERADLIVSSSTDLRYDAEQEVAVASAPVGLR